MSSYVDLSTVEHDGKRKWVYPIVRKGLWYYRRFLVAMGLIAFLLITPWTTVDGRQSLLIDFLNFRILFFGMTFHASEAIVILGLLFTVIAIILLLTAIFGRVFCGWACPQTVFMEFVYRPIEKLFEGEGASQKQFHSRPLADRFLVTGSKYAIFLVVSLIISNTLIAYFFGAHHLIDMMREGPHLHWKPFVGMSVVTGIILFQFAWFREQVCTFICPYGRLQSLLLDKDSLIVAYDARRGEPRGKMVAKTTEDLSSHSEPVRGDCVDCKLCIAVCPTGIDIRQGLQLECVSCTQCIDACDSIMNKLNRPTGLIRYDTESRLEGKPLRILRPRLFIYGILFSLGASLLFGFGYNRSWAKATLHRETSTTLFTKDSEGKIINTLRLHIQSLSDETTVLSVKAKSPDGLEIQVPSGAMSLNAHAKNTLHILALLPQQSFIEQKGRIAISLEITAEKPDIPSTPLTPLVLDTTLFGPSAP